jgi:hypothetical protein
VTRPFPRVEHHDVGADHQRHGHHRAVHAQPVGVCIDRVDAIPVFQARRVQWLDDAGIDELVKARADHRTDVGQRMVAFRGQQAEFGRLAGREADADLRSRVGLELVLHGRGDETVIGGDVQHARRGAGRRTQQDGGCRQGGARQHGAARDRPAERRYRRGHRDLHLYEVLLKPSYMPGGRRKGAAPCSE